jgi:hypothetical protein
MADSDETTILRFYDEFATDYHLAYGGNWETAVERQSARLAGDDGSKSLTGRPSD